ncbi:Succinyl-CoA:3-ketoacid coenzyme A transferase 1, mitochondrial [Hondaea fermentalgiana]|uniref:Succinyl-CoA:3-ketoacid coenzyme A transferase 1, mitochondrial n=1 Tax=Hondaea fermentalgiana TaxID=2315210 RepID=A0A2R5GGW7_9STRA|nr:Succinyl-CoA:3-ketoacid coenzyme A transferase 1, mitochondrial [Hondaea fermentalgiana]|eukprot:GBG27094.1 Succinyl-CoA:3-ketoacid coenzyme A transferase 1, mitochondrial [Hondaea fermentalgiana]
MVKRLLASHLGQIPDLHPRIKASELEAYAVPLGTIARIIRSRACGNPGYVTSIGLGTFVDPRNTGGKLNSATTEDICEVINLDDQEFLRYKTMNFDACIIRASVGDTEGNLTLENESLYSDPLLMATATRASGGIVIAQVDRLAKAGSLRAADVRVPAPLVDAVVVVSEPEHRSMGLYTNGYDPSLSGDVLMPLDEMPPLSMSEKKIMGRRAAMELGNHVCNLGIGAPEFVANCAQEAGILDHVTLTTEAGLFGGLGSSGLNFGSAHNPQARIELSQQFDYYNARALDSAFLGAAEIDASTGDVNVSNLGTDRFIGPGGFIDITQSTRRVIFMGTFTKKGLRVSAKDGALSIDQEGSIPMFKPIREVTFSGARALAQGQDIKYVTERAVFELTPQGLELVEVAPGIDLDKDVLAHMDPKPIVRRDTIKEMDPRIFQEQPMDLQEDFFRMGKGFKQRFVVREESSTCLFDASGLAIRSMQAVNAFMDDVNAVLSTITKDGAKKLDCVASYEGSEISSSLLEPFLARAKEVHEKYFSSVRRLGGKSFARQEMARAMQLVPNASIWEDLAEDRSTLSRKEFKEGLEKTFGLQFTEREIIRILGTDSGPVARKAFDRLVARAWTRLLAR